MFEYFGIESALLQSTFRQLLAGILGEKSLDDDERFRDAILSKFDEARVSLVLDSEDKSNIEAYLLVTGENVKLEKQTSEDTISGKCPLLLFDSTYRYTPPDGYTPHDSSWVRINFMVNARTKNARASRLPLLYKDTREPSNPPQDNENIELIEKSSSPSDDFLDVKPLIMTNVA